MGLQALRAPSIATAVALAGASLFLLAVGESPSVLWDALAVTLTTSFGQGYLLFYATPLIFTGLAVALPYHCGLFNIGAEGQLYLGAVAIVGLAYLVPQGPAWLMVPLAVTASALLGAFWGGLAGWLKARRGSHEVIVTILLNFIAIITTTYLILYPLDAPDNQAPESILVGAAFHLPTLAELFQKIGIERFQTTPANTAFFLAVAVACAAQFFLTRTVVGYELRAVGRNPRAALFAGIPAGRRLVLAMALGGACAGLVGVNEILGYHHSLIEGFSPGYGFTGIAVALLARSHPLGILLTALLFGALQNTAREMEFISEKVSKEISVVLQGILVAVAACDGVVTQFFSKKRRGSL